MIPYFYIIQHKQTKIYYAGCRFARNCTPSELLTEGGYLTSSHTVNELIREECIDAFAIRRIRIFSSADEALEYETRFLQKVDACNNARFYNRSNNVGFSAINQDVRRAIMVERYGVENPMQVKEIMAKARQTNLERYGVEHTVQSPEIQDKIRQTNLERYGVDNPSKSPEIQDKIRQTNLERYGVERPLQSKEFQAKIRQTNLERYGVEYAWQSKEVQDKIRQTNLERYGVDHFFKSEEGRKMLSERQKGAKHHRFKGWYITPKGRFASLREILDSAPELGTGVLRWCKNSSKVINKSVYTRSSYLNTNYDSSIIGKTFKELGFGFEDI